MRHLWYAVALPACLTAQTEHRTLSSPADVYDIAGTIRVVAGTGSDIVVDVDRAGADAGRLSIATGVLHDRQTLRVLYPTDRVMYRGMDRGSMTLDVAEDGTWGGNWHTHGRRVRVSSNGGLDAHADLTIHLPTGARLSLYLAIGSASVANVDGDVVADLGAASFTATHTRGALSIDAGSGPTQISDARGELSIDGGSGDVTLTNVGGERLEIDAGSGALRATTVAYRRAKLDLASGMTRISGLAVDEMSLDAGSGDVDLAFAKGIQRVKVDAGSGDVTLRLPASFAAAVDIDAGSGAVKSDWRLDRGRDDDSHFTGRIGSGGGGKMSIDSGSGTISLLHEP